MMFPVFSLLPCQSVAHCLGRFERGDEESRRGGDVASRVQCPPGGQIRCLWSEDHFLTAAASRLLSPQEGSRSHSAHLQRRFGHKIVSSVVVEAIVFYFYRASPAFPPLPSITEYLRVSVKSSQETMVKLTSIKFSLQSRYPSGSTRPEGDGCDRFGRSDQTDFRRSSQTLRSQHHRTSYQDSRRQASHANSFVVEITPLIRTLGDGWEALKLDCPLLP